MLNFLTLKSNFSFISWFNINLVIIASKINFRENLSIAKHGLQYRIVSLGMGGTYRFDRGPVWTIHQCTLVCVDMLGTTRYVPYRQLIDTLVRYGIQTLVAKHIKHIFHTWNRKYILDGNSVNSLTIYTHLPSPILWSQQSWNAMSSNFPKYKKIHDLSIQLFMLFWTHAIVRFVWQDCSWNQSDPMLIVLSTIKDNTPIKLPWSSQEYLVDIYWYYITPHISFIIFSHRKGNQASISNLYVIAFLEPCNRIWFRMWFFLQFELVHHILRHNVFSIATVNNKRTPLALRLIASLENIIS